MEVSIDADTPSMEVSIDANTPSMEVSIDADTPSMEVSIDANTPSMEVSIDANTPSMEVSIDANTPSMEVSIDADTPSMEVSIDADTPSMEVSINADTPSMEVSIDADTPSMEVSIDADTPSMEVSIDADTPSMEVSIDANTPSMEVSIDASYHVVAHCTRLTLRRIISIDDIPWCIATWSLTPFASMDESLSLRLVSKSFTYWLPLDEIVRLYDCSIGRRHRTRCIRLGVRMWGSGRSFKDEVDYLASVKRIHDMYHRRGREPTKREYCQFCIDDVREYWRPFYTPVITESMFRNVQWYNHHRAGEVVAQPSSCR